MKTHTETDGKRTAPRNWVQRLVRRVVARPFLRIKQTPFDLTWQKGWRYPSGKTEIEESGTGEPGMLIPIRKGTRVEHVNEWTLPNTVVSNPTKCPPHTPDGIGSRVAL